MGRPHMDVVAVFLGAPVASDNRGTEVGFWADVVFQILFWYTVKVQFPYCKWLLPNQQKIVAKKICRENALGICMRTT